MLQVFHYTHTPISINNDLKKLSVYGEYHIQENLHKIEKGNRLEFFRKQLTLNEISVVGLGKTYTSNNTSICVCSKTTIFGSRRKCNKENYYKVKCINLPDIGVVGTIICEEIKILQLAQHYKELGVDIVTLSLGFKKFGEIDRNRWIQLMINFSNITNTPLLCCSDIPSYSPYRGINLIIERT